MKSPQGPYEVLLDALECDAVVQRAIKLVATEVARVWKLSYGAALGFVISALGEPSTLLAIHAAWQAGQLSLVKLILRRRTLDLLGKDARPPGHASLSSGAEPAELDRVLSLDRALSRDPRSQLELQQIVSLVRGALACFARQGRDQQRQAALLQRYVLDETSYAVLRGELACSENALRVRVHKAMVALRRHIGVCHAELEELL